MTTDLAIELFVCGPCACLIANDDNSGDVFAADPEWRRAALESALTDRSAAFPVVACEIGDDDHMHPWSQQHCDVCGEYAEETHRVLADYHGRTYPAA